MPVESPLRPGQPDHFILIETFRFDPQAGFIRLPRHLKRMAQSAAALGFEFDERAARDVLDRAGLAVTQTSTPTPNPSPQGGGGHRAPQFPSPLRGGVRGGGNLGDGIGGLNSATSAHDDSQRRIRLTLTPGGAFNLAIQPFAPLPPDTVWRLAFAATRLDPADPDLRHKTSRRAAYEQARAEFARETADEVLLPNTRGEICEGTITNVFVERAGGILATPPLACGLLPGVLRAELLDTGQAVEQVLKPADLDAGAKIFVGNSLRGLIAAEPVSALGRRAKV